MNLVAADILLAALVLLSVSFALVRTRRLGSRAPKGASPTAVRVARIRQARDLRLGKRRR
jgi:hypothetical protein